MKKVTNEKVINEIEYAEKIGSGIREISNHLNKTDSVNTYLVKLIEKIGGEIVYQNDRNSDVKYNVGLTITKDGFKIRPNAFDSPIHDNFYITKALGDYILFKNDKNTRNFYASHRTDETNSLSNAFAYGFLTPKQEFIKKAKEYKNNITMLSSYFQIPTEMIEKRLNYLKDIKINTEKTR